MKFEIGKYYQHTTGSKLHICGLGETIIYGSCFIGEDEYGDLMAIGKGEENAVNYTEITKEQFIYVKPDIDMLDYYIELVYPNSLRYQKEMLKEIIRYKNNQYIIMRKGVK